MISFRHTSAISGLSFSYEIRAFAFMKLMSRSRGYRASALSMFFRAIANSESSYTVSSKYLTSAPEESLSVNNGSLPRYFLPGLLTTVVFCPLVR